MNSLWDDWFVIPFLSREERIKRYGSECTVCGRNQLLFPYCGCEALLEQLEGMRNASQPSSPSPVSRQQ